MFSNDINLITKDTLFKQIVILLLRREIYMYRICIYTYTLKLSHNYDHLQNYFTFSHKWQRICSTCRKHFPSCPHSRLITGFVTRLTRRVPLVEKELLTLPEHLSSPPVFSGVRVTQSLVLCVCFVYRCLSFCTFSFGTLCCLFFFDIRILITPLVSSNSSYYF